MSKSKTKTEQAWMDLVSTLPCGMCGAFIVELHHCREGLGMSQRARNFTVVPLCPDCHRGPRGVHGDKSLLRLYKTTEMKMLNDTVRQIAERFIA